MLNLWNETYTIIFVDMDNQVHQEQLENFELALERYMNVRKESQSFVLKNKSGMVISCDQHHNQPNKRIGSNTYFFYFHFPDRVEGSEPEDNQHGGRDKAQDTASGTQTGQLHSRAPEQQPA